MKIQEVQEVTVNEQNPQAVGFYEYMGFKTYKRTDHDEEGNPYPLLYFIYEKIIEKKNAVRRKSFDRGEEVLCR